MTALIEVPMKINLLYLSAGKNTCSGASDCRPRALEALRDPRPVPAMVIALQRV